MGTLKATHTHTHKGGIDSNQILSLSLSPWITKASVVRLLSNSTNSPWLFFFLISSLLPPFIIPSPETVLEPFLLPLLLPSPSPASTPLSLSSRALLSPLLLLPPVPAPMTQETTSMSISALLSGLFARTFL